MKNLLLILSVFALSLSYGQGTGMGPGDGSGSGSGEQGGHGYMWEGSPDVDLPPEIIALRTQLMEQRELLKQSRDALLAQLQEQGATDEEIRQALMEWRADHLVDFEAIRELAQQIRTYFRENRPERPRAQISEQMLQRRDQFRTNTQAVIQLRQQLRTMDPDTQGTEMEQVRTELREKLQERKAMLRSRRNQEAAGAGGDRRGGPGGE